MLTARRRRYVSVHVALLLGILFVLAAFGAFSSGLFVLLAVGSVLLGTELLLSTDVRPRWYGRVRWIVAAGLLLAVVTVGYRLVQLIAPEVIP